MLQSSPSWLLNKNFDWICLAKEKNSSNCIAVYFKTINFTMYGKYTMKPKQLKSEVESFQFHCLHHNLWSCKDRCRRHTSRHVVHLFHPSYILHLWIHSNYLCDILFWPHLFWFHQQLQIHMIRFYVGSWWCYCKTYAFNRNLHSVSIEHESYKDESHSVCFASFSSKQFVHS